jgi:hypothetical protein
MFTAYFDAAGNTGTGVTIVSGWLASVDQWKRFDEDWRQLLKRYDVPYFHMKEFAHSKKVFSSWERDEERRTSFLCAAVDIIAAYVYSGFACVVTQDVFNRVNRTHKLSEWAGNAYSLAGRDCVAHVRKWIRLHGNGAPVKYVFERGDSGKGHLMRVMERDKYSMPIFASSRDTPDGELGMLPLQAADFAAYEMRKAFLGLGGYAPLSQYRKSIKALASIPAWWGQYKERDLVDLCNAAHVPLRVKGLAE